MRKLKPDAVPTRPHKSESGPSRKRSATTATAQFTGLKKPSQAKTK